MSLVWWIERGISMHSATEHRNTERDLRDQDRGMPLRDAVGFESHTPNRAMWKPLSLEMWRAFMLHKVLRCRWPCTGVIWALQPKVRKKVSKGVARASRPRGPKSQKTIENELFFSRKTREGWNCRFRKTPRTEVGTRSLQCGLKVPGRFAFPGNPRICSIWRFGKNFSSNFPGLFPGLSSRTPARTPETATAFSSFLIF